MPGPLDVLNGLGIGLAGGMQQQAQQQQDPQNQSNPSQQTIDPLQQQGPQGPNFPSWLTDAMDKVKQQQQEYEGTRNQVQQQINSITDYLKPTKRDLDIQKMIAYTPEKRTQDLMSQFFGINKKQLPGPVQEGQEPQYNTKINKTQMITSMLGEAARAFTHGNKYVPVEERMRAQAEKEYAAEVSPLTREMYYDTLTKRTVAQNAAREMGNVLTNANRNIANTTAQMGQLTRAQQEISQAQLNQKRGEYLAASTEFRQGLTAQQGVDLERKMTEQAMLAQFGTKPGTMPPDAYMINQLQKAAKQTTGKEMPYAAAAGEWERIKAQQWGGRFNAVEQGNGGQFFNLNKTTGTATPFQMGGQNPQGPGNGEAARSYYRGMGTPFSTGYKPQGTEKLAPEDQEILTNYPMRAPLRGNDLTRARGSQLGYENAQDMYKVIQAIPDKDFGTVGGLLAKFTAGHLSGADPNITKYLQQGQILGANHSAAQGFRSTEFVKEIGGNLSKFTNKQALLESIRAYEKTFTDQLANYPELKALPFAKQMNAAEQLRVFHPDIYEKYAQQVQQQGR
jgi:hypothetical protein